MMSTLLAWCGIASALNPSLDISQYAHTSWTIREGYFKGRIHTIAQTPDGYLWIGTEFGLLRFDGIRSTSWQPPLHQQLPDERITRLLTSRDGTLWIGTQGGVASWKDGKLTPYPALAGLDVLSLIEDREGTVWAGTYARPAGLLCAIRAGSAQCFGQDGTLGVAVASLIENDGYVWAGTATGLWRWRPGPPKRYLPESANPQAMIRGDQGDLLVVVQGEVDRLVNGRPEPYAVPGVTRGLNPKHFLRDGNGGLWIGTANHGLLFVHQGRAERFEQSDGLSGNAATAIYEDREGTIWVGTDGGLDRFRDFAIPSISATPGSSTGTAGSVLAAADGSIWIGTFNGLSKWTNGQVATYTQKDGLPDDAVESLFQDDHGRIWVSTGRGVVHFENGRFAATSVPRGGYVHAIAQDNLGGFWFNQDQSLVHLTPGNAIEEIPWPRFGGNEDPWSLIADPMRGGVWLGFVDRMAYFKDGRIQSYTKADGLGGGQVADLRVDADGAVWAATGGGLSRLKDGHITTLTSSNGLPCDTVHWSLEDDNHSVWLHTACGVVRIARADLDAWVGNPKHSIQTTLFDNSDGVRISAGPGSAYSPRVVKAKDGRIWFVAGAELNIIDPRYLAFNKIPPPVSIEQIIADRKPYDMSSHLPLPALTRDLEIDYNALSLVAPEKNRYRVKLEGHDPDWIDMGNERKKFYNDLPPRNYRFRVMASNNSGVWNEAGASFDFSVDPKYYQTTWFKALCAFAGLALLWGLYRYRLHQIAREFNVRLEERVGERTRIARDLHDTLLQSFQGLMLHLQVVDDLLPQGKAKVELERTLERADAAIAEGRTAVYDLRSSATTTNDLAHALREVGNELATPGTATFRLMVEGPSRDLHPIIRDELYRIAREALRNAFSHAQADHVETELIYADRLFQLRIRDDGQGIASEILKEGRPGHYGLPGMRERAKQIGAKLTIWSGGGTGTEIALSLEGSIAYGGTLPGSTLPGRSRLRLFGKKVG
ncbi:MAG TPA: two-component regulator propeller domain-containing protein [Bryobacteraceae bacterium]|jgi:signal transduction histidine kinase/ligand-binding sensor domain-containing protein